jgi:hypothetical protein
LPNIILHCAFAVAVQHMVFFSFFFLDLFLGGNSDILHRDPVMFAADFRKSDRRRPDHQSDKANDAACGSAGGPALVGCRIAAAGSACRHRLQNADDFPSSSTAAAAAAAAAGFGAGLHSPIVS